jgi:hypothetical protein
MSKFKQDFDKIKYFIRLPFTLSYTYELSKGAYSFITFSPLSTTRVNIHPHFHAYPLTSLTPQFIFGRERVGGKRRRVT